MEGNATNNSFQPLPARQPPQTHVGAQAWLRKNLFFSPAGSVATVVIVAIALYLLWGLLDWAVFKAVWRTDNAACRALEHSAACWGVIGEKYRLIVFGRFPFEQQWRPLVGTLMLVALIIYSARPAAWKRALLIRWVVALVVFFFLMRGGLFGLEYVETSRWGGLPLTIVLSIVGIVAGFPLAIALALGRRSSLPGIRTICIVFIELVRGVPLVSVLFMASFMFPLFMPSGVNIDVLLRVVVGITLFSGAYLAEVIRGGLQAVPKGQIEAAQTLGLSYWQTQRKIVLPRALRTVVPAIVSTFIATFKDTSLVTAVSLYELTGSLQLALGDAEWRAFYMEGYIFIAIIYFVCCYSMSRYSRWIEALLYAGTRRA